jgi:transcriptional regulator with XRE-family HTH domain
MTSTPMNRLPWPISNPQQWRENLGLSVRDLSELTGYSGAAIRLFESGENTLGKPHNAAAAKRYKLACLAVMFLRSYQINLEQWEWTV